MKNTTSQIKKIVWNRISLRKVTFIQKVLAILGIIFLFRNVILKKKDSLGAPDKNFILKVAVGLSLENAADNLHEKTKIWAGMKNKVTEIRLRCYNHGEI